MCGIAGIIQSVDGSFNKSHLRKMTDALVHRGPEAEGLWENGDCSALLGHRRLCIIDLSEAAGQPMHFNEGGFTRDVLSRYTIVHNGEIYNYKELRETLTKVGYSFQTSSDTEVILAAYDHFADECVEHFDGMFAFAIWDEKEKELFAARDRFGEKPFFYSMRGNEFVFASEMKAFWQAGIEKRPNLRMLFNFITIGYADNPAQPAETFFENIFKLPPASILYYTPASNELIIEKYWDLDPAIQNKTISDTEALEKFDHLLSTSISRRLRSDVRVGTSLSGGLDSSTIVAKASAFFDPSSFNSFTATFPGFEKDESVYAHQVASKFQLKENRIDISVNDFVNDWEKFLYHQEEPFGSASAYAQFKVFEKAKSQGVTVLLDGQGADETLAGYSKYYRWYWQELFQKRKLGRSKELEAAKELGVRDRFSFRNVIAALFPDIASVVLERQYLLHALKHEGLTREFVKFQSKEAYYTTPANFDLNGVLYFNTSVHGLEELLRYADRNSMAHGREVRLPFSQPRTGRIYFLIAFSLQNKAWVDQMAITAKHE